MALLTILLTAGVLVCTCLGYLVRTVYTHRRKINELRKRGVPMPKEWSWVTDHLLVLQRYVDKIPPDAAVAFAMRDLSEEYADEEIFLVDFWPVYPALFTVFGPNAIEKICNNLISMNGDEWKYWRSLFNPGFSTGAMLNNVPHIVDSVLVFREKLIEKIGKGMFSLDEFTTKLTMEVILKVTLDDSSNYQRAPHILPTALGRILSWHSFWDPRILLNPSDPLFREKRLLEIRAAKSSTASDGQPKAIKSVITLALEAYLDEGGNVLDERFAKFAASQIRLFLFAGTDTTASILVYIYHMLAKHPEWRTKLRQEHDEVFGERSINAIGLLREIPSLLDNCKLTLAFIKETLHCGIEQPMDYAGANVLHQALHLNPRVWPRADEFLPERFLVGPEDEMHPDPAAFRPFEQGPRNCIGQTLVYNELRIAVILTCRDLEIRDAYEDFDRERESQLGAWGRWKRTVFGEPLKTLHGDRAYQTDSGGAHPVDGYPCYAKWAKDI
ncbi:putative cytochrome P450 [Hypoxylon sp. FL1150]|nr:putative cytochrome P450 [Hypoxylon sp. FL1150]